VFEVAQSFGEQVGGDAGQCRAEVGEPLLSERELAQDQQRPAVADAVERGGDPAVLLVALVGHAVSVER
jgi:hypothetical protein